MRQQAQTVIITGGSGGLGYECARELARSDASRQIILAGRDKQRVDAAAERLIRASGSSQIAAMELDLASLASVRAFVSAFTARHSPPLRALVCNAGVQVPRPLSFTADGFETMFQVNHLGHFLLVNLLLEQLAAPARIVFVSSGTHDPAEPERLFGRARYLPARELALPDTAARDAYGGIGRYATTKLLNILCAYELHRRLQASGLSSSQRPISVFAYDPGAVPGTGLSRDWPAAVQAIWRSGLLRRFVRLGGAIVSDAETSGRAMARLLTDPALEADAARYFRIGDQRRSSRDSYDLEYARDLWETSVELAQLQPDESPISHPTHAHAL